MPILECPIESCTFATQDIDIGAAAIVLQIHGSVHQNAPHRPVPHVRAPKLERPRIKMNATSEEWNAFQRRWDTYRTGSGITDASAAAQLLECTTEDLGNITLRAYPDFTTSTMEEAIRLLKSLAVVPVALGVVRAELSSMVQGADEQFRTFAARVQGKAETCEFKTSFRQSCNNCDTIVTGQTYYTDERIRDVLLNGIADMDIRREALSSENIHNRPINDIISFVEAREIARNASPSVGISSVSEYRRSRVNKPMNRSMSPSAADKARTAPCPDCGTVFHLFTHKPRGWNKKPHERCASCWKRRRNEKKNEQGDTSAISVSEGSNPFGQMCALSSTSITPIVSNPTVRKPSSPKPVTLSHHVFSKAEWRRAQLRNHPSTQLTITNDSAPSQSTTVNALADSGAQTDVWSMDEFVRAGFSVEKLHPVRLSLNAANKSAIHIDGAFFGTISGRTSDGTILRTKSMIYVSRDVRGFYLSYDTMLNLNMLPKSFPAPGCAGLNLRSEGTEGLIQSMNSHSIPTKSECDCPKRTTVPPRPDKLPFECSPENNERMKAWLLDYFKESTFNNCPHTPLPAMEGPPLEIHLKDDAKPFAHTKAARIPLHWQQQVYEDLMRDIDLGVIERVPENEQVTWCHRMVVSRKHDGSPRRTVDASRMNKYCRRDAYATESPFHVVRRIPSGTWKTVVDAWNGYHSIPLRESDKHLTTFITPFGLFRYKRALQGFKGSGDGYNRRLDATLSTFGRKERVVDDMLHHDDELEQHWWRTIDLLIKLGSSGTVLNPKKFQFAQKQVEFAGFQVSDNTIEPLPKYLNAIRDFPTPQTTTDIRSWFGLINQVANYAQLRDHLAIFRPYLSPKHPFEWTDKLDTAFNESKTAIIEAIRKGVEIFDLQKPTCLRPDWSCKGIGYFLLQQHCNCQSALPDCCPNGWKITLAGSRFLQDAERRYAPIEGEALGVAWGLEQTRYFTLGCDDLLVVTDHKPLTKLLGDRRLDEIKNTRLFRIKQRTLPWFFSIVHMPGRFNGASDATSRHPSPSDAVDYLEESDLIESALMASIQQSSTSDFSLSWERLAKVTHSEMSSLLQCVRTGFTNNLSDEPSVKPYWQYRESLYELDGVILYNDRVVIPPSLRQEVLRTLHSAHQGVSTMEARAREIVFWPGYTNDIADTRNRCNDCIKNAPSQSQMPPAPPHIPSTPFESTVADFFDLDGQHYLVVADRLSGWPEVFKCKPGSPQSGSQGLVSCLINCFACYGVPVDLSSDGGPEFIASNTESFLKRWGVNHRLSSAYHPQSNGRAEVAVKTVKRLLRSNTSPSGTLDTEKFLTAMLQLRNTPDPECKLSPAQVLFGRPLRDSMSFVNRLEKYSNPNVRQIWRDAWEEKEAALRTRYHRTAESLASHARPLQPLLAGDRCYVQNQAGNYPKRWDRSGTVVEVLDHDSYVVKVDGSGRLTRRNRRFLRKFQPVSPCIPSPPQRSQSTGLPPISTPEVPAQADRLPITPPDSASTPPNVLLNCEPESGSNVEAEPLVDDNVLKEFDSVDHPTAETQTREPRVRRAKQFYEPETGKWVSR